MYCSRLLQPYDVSIIVCKVKSHMFSSVSQCCEFLWMFVFQIQIVSAIQIDKFILSIGRRNFSMEITNWNWLCVWECDPKTIPIPMAWTVCCCCHGISECVCVPLVLFVFERHFYSIVFTGRNFWFGLAWSRFCCWCNWSPISKTSVNQTKALRISKCYAYSMWYSMLRYFVALFHVLSAVNLWSIGHKATQKNLFSLRTQ